MIGHHEVAPSLFTELAAGGYPAAARMLREAQLSRHLLLLRYIVDAAPPAAASRYAEAGDVLDAARARDPGGAAEVLADPLVGAWAAQEVRRLNGVPTAVTSWQAGLCHLAGLAAATAARAGLEVDLAVQPDGPTAMIPTVGLLTDLGRDGSRRLELRVRDGSISVTGSARWRLLRRLTCEQAQGPAISVALDDVNPYRDVYHVPAARRISDDDHRQWQLLFDSAYRLLSRRAARRAVEIGGILRTVVPLRGQDGRMSRSATSRHAFGALGASRPSSAAETAITLVHETQHSKLNSLLSLVPLFDPDTNLYHAPWREDPRPIWGFFHGIYAFLAVADLHDKLRAESACESAAEKQFAVVRGQLRPAMQGLLSAPSLTPAGRRFAAVMADDLSRLEAIPVSRAAHDHAVRRLNADRARWQRRNSHAG